MAPKKPALKYTPRGVVKKIYQILFDTVRALDKLEIKYWAIGGTLLGIQRHRGLIPWDDDADLGVFITPTKLTALRKTLGVCGYKIQKIWFGYKIFDPNNKSIKGEKYTFPNVDLFTFKRHNARVIPTSKVTREVWPKEYYSYKSLLVGGRGTFGDYLLNTPGDLKAIKAYLNRTYGKDWSRIAYVQYSHAEEKELEKIKTKLTSEMRQAALPTKVVRRRCLN